MVCFNWLSLFKFGFVSAVMDMVHTHSIGSSTLPFVDGKSQALTLILLSYHRIFLFCACLDRIDSLSFFFLSTLTCFFNA